MVLLASLCEKVALLRWLLTRHIVAEYTVTFKSMTSSEGETDHHPDFGSPRNARETIATS